jgi:DNA-binding SARP family transcriptional activator
MSEPTSTSLPRLEIVCFGPPRARIDGQEPEGSVIWRKNLALLVHLALADNRTSSRNHLVGLFWPEKPEEKARHSLNEAVRRLRSALGAARLISNGDILTLNDEALHVDVLAFERMAGLDPASASALPRGEFLEGFVIDDAPTFEHWVSEQRARLHGLWASTLLAHGEVAVAANRFRQAVDDARAALRLEPYLEPAVDLLIRASALAGDASGAQALYNEFQTRLAQEIGGTPGPGLQSLVTRVREGKWQATGGRFQQDEPPLVGREGVHRTAFELVGQAPRTGVRCLVVIGEPGMGKSRLLNECVDRLALVGCVVTVARPLESDQDTPWSTLRLLIRGLANASGVSATDPRALAVLASLVPDLAERVAPVEPRDNADVAAALSAMLAAVADEQSVGLAVDDAHLADRASLDVLDATLRQLESAPVLIALSATPSGYGPRELLRLRGDLGRAIPGVSVELGPIDEEATRDLVVQMAPWCTNEDDIDRLTRRLLFEVKGNPMMAVTILRALAQSSAFGKDALRWPRPRSTIETPLPFTMPDLLRTAVLARVSALDEGTRDVLSAASVGDMAVDPSLVALLTGMPPADVERELEILEQHHFVVFDEARYMFVAPLLKKAVEEACLSRGKRQRFRQHAVNELGRRDSISSRILRIELMAKTEMREGAYQEAIELAEEAIVAGSHGAARRLLAAAESAVGPEDGRRARVSEMRRQLDIR